MMKRNTLIFFLFIVIIFMPLYAQESSIRKEDPFEPLLPEKQTQPGEAKPKTPMPPPINIEGVLWGTENPQTIIDGEVYKVGDTLKNFDAKIYKIEKNNVFIFYEGRLYEMRIEKNKKEAR